jgi:hypothetical protein
MFPLTFTLSQVPNTPKSSHPRESPELVAHFAILLIRKIQALGGKSHKALRPVDLLGDAPLAQKPLHDNLVLGGSLRIKTGQSWTPLGTEV